MPYKDSKRKAVYDAAYNAAHRKERAAYRASHRKERAAYNAAHRKERAAYDAAYDAAHPEYGVWQSMIRRCTNPNSTDYKNYGALGIRVAKRWYKFENFLADLGKRPSKNHSLSRIADTGDYKPRNVVWGTRKHQQEQKRIKRMRKQQCL